MATSFPREMGVELGGKTFDQVFDTNPKIIEFVTIWTDSCTGVFDDFRMYVKARLCNPLDKEEHENRCREIVKTLKGNVPRYLLKYVIPVVPERFK
jgi:hypothetical protein